MGHARRRVALVCALATVVITGAAVTASSDAAIADSSVAGGSDVRTALSAPKAHTHEASDFQNSIVEAAHLAAEAGEAKATGPTLPTGFSDQKVIGGVSEAVGADFASDGTAFVALKTGQIKVATYDSAAGTFGTATDFADLSTQVNNYGDRGLTGIAVDPKFPTRPYVYVNYTYNKDPRDGSNGVVPKWGTAGQAYDECPTPASETDTTIPGCVVQDRVTRLTATQQSGSWTMTGAEKELLVGGCYQFSSHASGDVAFGPDGKLYASSGEGASFNTLDDGQYANPCADPNDEGGSLRSQDYRSASTSDPLGVDGTVFRLDPDVGIVPTQANANQWLVAYGQRNPWRLTFRPTADGSGVNGLSNELWSGDVGASKAEEVNKIADVTAVTTPINRGWPCYEGNFNESAVQPGWDALNLPLCETLYSQGLGAVSKPYFSYQTRDGGPLVPGEDCANETSSVSGIAFPTFRSNYPSAFRNAMFFSDFARSCIWVLGKTNGEPDPTKIQTFVQAAATPVDLLTGPGGDLYYVDYGISPEGAVVPGGAGVHRIVYTGSNGTPTARITTNPMAASGPSPLLVNFSGSASTDPDADTLTYSWDLDGNGSFETTGVTTSRTYTTGTYTVSLKVDDGHGHTHTTTTQVQAGNTAPTLGSVTPASSLTWAVGDTISFSATASDDGQAMPPSAFSWQLEIRHCPSGVCHTHPFGTFSGATGSFTAPPHEYPSHLLLTVTVTDSGGLTDTRTIQLNPKTVDLTFASAPSGAVATVGETDHPAPYTETFIQKSPVTVSAAATTGSGATVAAFSSWSDGGARSHTVTPGTSNATLTATYTRPTASLSASPASGSAPLNVTYTASGTNASGVTGAITYAWDLDNDGAYDDGTGATKTGSYSAFGPTVVKVLATDSRGATDAKSVTVTVNNTAPTATIATTPSPASGAAPLNVSFDGTTSTDPNPGDTLTYDWDLDGNGSFETLNTPKPTKQYGIGTTTVTLRVTDNHGGSAAATRVVTASNSAPTVTSMTPAAGTTWSVGQVVNVSATATDPQETLPDTAYTWTIERQDCASGCPRTVVTTIATRTGSFTVPEMPYPSHLFVSVAVKDSQNQTTAQTRQLEPKTAALQFATSPAPGTVTVGGTDRTATWSQTFVQGAHVAVSAPDTRTVDGATYGFASWSDAGARSHTVTVPVTATTYTATYTRQNRLPLAVITTDPSSASGPAPLAVTFDASGSSDPDAEALTYAWDLDADGQYDDGSGVTATATYPAGSVAVGLRVTDVHAGTGAATTTVTATNTAPTVTGVGVYPGATYAVGQVLGFDAAATDAQQELPASAYSFVIEKQPCDSGCPRQVAQRWSGVTLGQFTVPAIPYPSHLYLTATVVDAQGATATSTVRIDPRPVNLTVGSKKVKVKIAVDGVKQASGWSGQFVIGSSVSLVVPKHQTKNGVRYAFVRWTDGGDRKHVVTLGERPLSAQAIYRKIR